MSLTAREKKLLELAESRGARIDWKAANRKFKLTSSPIITVGIDVNPLIKLCNKADNELESKDAEFELSGIVLFPIITDPAIFKRVDFITHKRASRGFFVGQNIDFEKWRNASSQEQYALALSNYRNSILAIPERHFHEKSKAALITVLESAHEQML